MKIAQNPYPIDFSRIDNPVEALLVPPFNISAVTAPPGVKLVTGKVRAGLDSFTFSSPNAEPEDYRAFFTRGEQSSSIAFTQRTHDSVRYRGKFGDSAVDLQVGIEQAGIRGRIGEVEVRQAIHAPGFSRYLLAEGEVGGLAYSEKFYLGESGISHSEGKLGEMKIKRQFTDTPNGQTVKGHIGETEFEEFIVYR